MDEAMELTRRNTETTLTVAFNYGGRAEIVDAVRGLVAEGVKPSDVNERALRRHLYVPGDAGSRPVHPHLGRVPDL